MKVGNNSTNSTSGSGNASEAPPSMYASLVRAVQRMLTPEGFQPENIGNSKSLFAFTRPGASSLSSKNKDQNGFG